MSQAHEFEDRTPRLFGRQKDISDLLSRAGTSGLTVIAARPKMGKTWLYEEVGRQLDDMGFLVGYHECLGGGDLLLRAVQDLYLRWFATTSFKEQAKTLARQSEGEWIGNVGKVFGSLFQKATTIADPASAASGKAVRAAFEELAILNQKLKTGLVLDPLPYDQAAELLKIVARVQGDGCRFVLILDAWEQSSALETESHAFEALLKNLDKWPPCHVFLGVRQPELGLEKGEKAFQFAKDLDAQSPKALLRRLETLDLSDPEEKQRLVGFLRSHLDFAEDVTDEALVALLSGFAGTLDNWLDHESGEGKISVGQLQLEAEDALNYRYREFETLLPRLKGGVRRAAVRLALLPRMDKIRWSRLEPVALDGLEAEVVADLGSPVLKAENYPTYGHETRHAAAQRWFLTNQPMLCASECKALIHYLVNDTAVQELDRSVAEALRDLREPARKSGLKAEYLTVVEAASWLFERSLESEEPLLRDSFKSTSIEVPGSETILSQALVNRGAAHRAVGKHEEALADYSSVIELEGAPLEPVAQALFNRGVAHGAAGRREEALADYSSVIELEGAPLGAMAQALVNRGVAHGAAGRHKEALADCTSVVELPGAPLEQVAKALVNRGVAHRAVGKHEEALADYSSVIELEGAPLEQVTTALFNRGVAHGAAGKHQEASADYSAVIELEGALVEQVGRALVNRGVSREAAGKHEEALADYGSVIELEGAPLEQVAMALVNRGVAHGVASEHEEALADCTSAIELEGAPLEQVAKALFNRGVGHGAVGKRQEALADYSSVTELEGAPVELVAKALFNRGVAHRAAGRHEEALADYTSVIELEGAPLEQVAKALLNRGVEHGVAGKHEEASADYTSVIELEGAPLEQVAKALACRVVAYRLRGEDESASRDAEALLALPNLPAELKEELLALVAAQSAPE